MFRNRLLLSLLALVICTGTAQALGSSAYLTSTIKGTGNLSCDTSGGKGGSVQYTIALTTAGKTLNVTVGATASGGGTLASIGLAASASSSAAITGTGTVVYTFTTLNGCAYASQIGSSNTETYTPTVQFTATVSAVTTNDVTQALSVAVTSPATSPLTPVAGITVSCTKSASGYTGGTTNFSVATTLSQAGGSVPVTVDPSFPTWITSVAPSSSNLANQGVSAQFVVTVNSGNCSGSIGSSRNGYIHLLNYPAYASLSIPVTLQVVGPTVLTLGTPSGTGVTGAGTSTGNAIGIPYTIKQAATETASVNVTSASNVFVIVDMTTVPAWLTVNFPQFTASTSPVSLQFTVTKVADSMTPGLQPQARITLNVAGYSSTYVYINLTVQNPAPTLSVVEGQARHLAWSLGQPLPTATITALSSGTPIPYTVSINTGSPDAGAIASPVAGLAFSSGTPIAITFNSAAFAAATPGTTLNTTVVLNWTLGTTSETTPITFTVGIQAPSTTANLTGVSPTSLPSATAGQTFLVTLYGSGFVPSTLTTQKTWVGVLSGTALVAEPAISWTVADSSTINVTITVPTGGKDTNVDFTTPGASLSFGVCNPSGVTPPCTGTGGTETIKIDAGPTIQSITSASTFATVTPSTGTLAPYDIITIFGNNFCTIGGQGCSNSTVLYPVVSASDVYGNIVTPDAGQHNLQVWFCPNPSTATTCGAGWAAPLLFATNTQINAVVPSEIITGTIASPVPTQYDIYVKFGTSAAPLSSTAYTFTSAITDPGVFVVDGSNNGAVVIDSGANLGYVANLNDAQHAARLRVGTASDWVSIYMTGLGTPLSTALNSKTSGSSVSWTDCISPNSYAAYAGLGATLPDGAVIQGSIITNGLLPPCFQIVTAPYVGVTVGTLTAPLKYVGWAPDSIAGLYQVNVQLPASGVAIKDITDTSAVITGPTQVPVVVTVSGGNPVTTSPTVNMWVQPAMTFTAAAPNVNYPVLASSLGSGSVALDTVTAVGGTGTVAYVLVSQTGPQTTGVSLDTTTTPGSAIVNMDTALLTGTYTLVISAADGGTGGTLPLELITLTFTVS